MGPNTDGNGTPPEFLTAAEVAAWFRVGLSTIYHWRASGRIPSVTFNGIVRFPRQQLTSWMQQHTSCPSALSDQVSERASETRPRTLTHRTMGAAAARVRRRLISSKNPIHHGDDH
jgi:excisionase family DNA binding protein